MTLPADRDAAAADALLTDLYLDALLAGAVLAPVAPGDPAGSPADAAAATLDPAARRAADRLRRDLVRVHPSFRFEERLATKLAEAAASMRVPLAAGAEGRVVAFRPAVGGSVDPAAPVDGPDATAAMSGTADAAGTPLDPLRRPARPLLIGGALTSAALSIAGAAWVAWRLGRPGRGLTPMARAARAVREARLASASSADGTVTTIARAARRRLD